jgi:transcriptional regulator with XRE-family HTH domain
MAQIGRCGHGRNGVSRPSALTWTDAVLGSGGIFWKISGRLFEREQMKTINQLGNLVKSRREGLGLTQRSLAQKLGVEASHVAFIESGRRKPSLRLVARMADALRVDRQNLLILAHPEAKALLAEPKPEPGRKAAPSWQRFIKNHELLARYHVSDRELQALEHLSLLGSVHSAKEFLAILTLIRDIPPVK